MANDSINPEELADANLTEIEKEIRTQIRKVSHILERLFKAADNDNGYVMEPKDVRVLVSWIIDIQNINSMAEQKIQAMQKYITEMHKKQEDEGSRLWRPGPPIG